MMRREDAEMLYQAYERALGALAEAEAALWSLPRDVARDDCIRANADVVVAILSGLWAPLVVQYPDLDTSAPVGQPDTRLEHSEHAIVSRLTAAQIQQIDEALLSDCGSSWRKVVRVVGKALAQISAQSVEIPSSYYALRVKALVQAGRLESQGDLDYMRFSEVRLPEQTNRKVVPQAI